MARPGLSEAQVVKAANQLASKGKNVSVGTIREVLGSGSYSTINKHLSKWREAKKQEQLDAIPEIPEEVLAILGEAWTIAWNSANSSLEEERKALDVKRAEMEEQGQFMEDEIVRLEKDLASQREENRALKQSLEKEIQARKRAEGAANQHELENVRITEQLKGKDVALNELRIRAESLENKLAERIKKPTA